MVLQQKTPPWTGSVGKHGNERYFLPSQTGYRLPSRFDMESGRYGTVELFTRLKAAQAALH
jgi:hypothetical protein